MPTTSALPSTAAVLLLGMLALTGCQQGSAPAPGAPPARTHTSDPVRNTDSDGYAFQHPCTMGQLSVMVTRRAGEPAQRVIAVRNTGSRACGLSLHPGVSLDEAASEDMSRSVEPLVPCNRQAGPEDMAEPGDPPDACHRGGPSAYPLRAGQTAYAVIDLDPSGGSSRTTRGIDELNILPDADHMDPSGTINIRLEKGTSVLKPKLGLYCATPAAAATSMQSAHTRP